MNNQFRVTGFMLTSFISWIWPSFVMLPVLFRSASSFAYVSLIFFKEANKSIFVRLDRSSIGYCLRVGVFRMVLADVLSRWTVEPRDLEIHGYRNRSSAICSDRTMASYFWWRSATEFRWQWAWSMIALSLNDTMLRHDEAVTYSSPKKVLIMLKKKVRSRVRP